VVGLGLRHPAQAVVDQLGQSGSGVRLDVVVEEGGVDGDDGGVEAVRLQVLDLLVGVGEDRLKLVVALGAPLELPLADDLDAEVGVLVVELDDRLGNRVVVDVRSHCSRSFVSIASLTMCSLFTTARLHG
jgi:hypothetical protein